MKKNYIWNLSFFILFLFGGLSILIPNENAQKLLLYRNQIEDKRIKIPKSSASPIYIVGDANLASYCAGRGSGTPSDPYRIENLDISVQGSTCITLINISISTLIQKCNLHDTSTAIRLDNVLNCTIYDNTIFSCSGIGIDAQFGNHTNIKVISNIFQNPGDYGIWVCNGTFGNYNSNTIQGAWLAMFLLQCPNSTVSDNNLINNSYGGLGLQNSVNMTVMGNSITQSKSGIGLLNSNICKMYLNSIFSCSETHAFESSGNTWDNGTDGNYWSDYTIRYPSATKTGNHWNTQYQINTSMWFDRFPFIDPPNNRTPTLISPTDIEYNIGDTGKSISWVAFDAIISSPTYSITKNGTALVGPLSWSSGSAITLSIDGLAVGFYLYTITINDGLGLTATDEVIVNVKEKSTSNTTSNDTNPSKDADKKGINGPNNLWICGLSAIAIIAIIQKRNKKIEC